jgi:hypothetical protein
VVKGNGCYPGMGYLPAAWDTGLDGTLTFGSRDRYSFWTRVMMGRAFLDLQI